MITHKEWKEYKKKHDVPDGLCDKVSMGDVQDPLDRQLGHLPGAQEPS